MTRLATAFALIALASCAHTGAATNTAVITGAVSAPDRLDKDKKKDAQHKPEQTLAFLGVAPGMHVAELGAGGGYTTELVARVVGPGGTVIAQDTIDWASDQLTQVWQMRLARPGMQNTTHVMRQWDDPLPADAKNLDLVYNFATYHDVIVEKIDENKMNAAVFAALKSGGVYVVVDNSAKDGSGNKDCEPLHRIDEKLVREEVERAGFKLVEEASFLRNPADTRDWNANPGSDPKSHTQDMFALKFVKP
jgi:predicted methyltransferase